MKYHHGTKTDIISDHYTITYGKSQASIDGQSDITIGVDINYTLTKTALNNHYDIQVGPNANINIQVDKAI